MAKKSEVDAVVSELVGSYPELAAEVKRAFVEKKAEEVDEYGLTEDQKKRLIQDHRDWTGGYDFHEHHQPVKYRKLSMPSDIPRKAAKKFMEAWTENPEEFIKKYPNPA